MNSENEFKNVSKEIIENDKIDQINLIITRLNNNIDALKDFIESLDFYINSKKIPEKKKAFKLLLNVISELDQNKLNFKKIENLSIYLFKVLKDVTISNFVVRIIYTIITKNEDNINEEGMTRIFSLILENFDTESFYIPSFNQEVRFFSLKTLLFFLEKHKDLVNKNENVYKFMKIVLDAFEDEKDPRNIIVLFQFIQELNKKLDKTILNHYKENIFEIMDLYYPIEFTPPKNSPDRITGEQLSNELNKALTTSDLYINRLIDMLKERISSANTQTKIDVINTINSINENYPASEFSKYFIVLVDLLLNEILNNSEEIIHVHGIITFKNILKKFSEFEPNEEEKILNEHIMKNIRKIYSNCEDLLFASENVKNSYDAKDLIIILCEYFKEFRISALKISIKLLSVFFEQNQKQFINNSSGIINFVLKDYYNNEEQMSYIKENNSILKNLVTNLFKKESNDNDVMLCIYDVITQFTVKTDLFDDYEIKEIFVKLNDLFRNANPKQEIHLANCLNQFILMNSSLNNALQIIETTNYLLKSHNDSEIKQQIFKFLILLEVYLKNPLNSLFIFEYLLNLLINISLDPTITDKENFQNFILKILKSFFQVNLDLDHTRIHNLVIMFLQKVDENQIFIAEKLVKYYINSNFINNKLIEHLIDFNLNQLNEKPRLLRIIMKILENNNNLKNNYQFSYNILLSLLKLMDNHNMFKKNEVFQIKSLIFYDSFKHQNSLTEIFNQEFYNLRKSKENIDLLSMYINMKILLRTEDSIEDFKDILQYLTTSDFTETHLLKFNKSENLDKVFLTKIINILEDFFNNSSNNEVIVMLIVRLLSSLPDEILLDYYSIAFKYSLISINMKKYEDNSVLILKKIIPHLSKEYYEKNSINLNNVVENFINLITRTVNFKSIVDIITVFIHFRQNLGNKFDQNLRKRLVKELKKLLSHPKRIVRKTAGVCINHWLMDE